MFIWLEFKNDEEFDTGVFGGIAGGSAFKFGIYKRKEDGAWISGSTRVPKVCSLPEAIDIAKNRRDLLVCGAEIIGAISDDRSDQTYLKLQEELEKSLGSYANLGWVHKYFYLLYPEKIDDFHSPEWQSFYLAKLQQIPAQQNKRYSVAGQFLRATAEAGLMITQYSTCLEILFDSPQKYWRVGTTDSAGGKSFWSHMKNSSYISVGWPELGDMRELDELSDAQALDRLKGLIGAVSDKPQSTISNSARQFLDFYRNVRVGDIVVAVQGQKVMGTGRVSGDYEYRQGLEFAHLKAMEWLLDFNCTVNYQNGHTGKQR